MKTNSSKTSVVLFLILACCACFPSFAGWVEFLKQERSCLHQLTFGLPSELQIASLKRASSALLGEETERRYTILLPEKNWESTALETMKKVVARGSVDSTHWVDIGKTRTMPRYWAEPAELASNCSGMFQKELQTFWRGDRERRNVFERAGTQERDSIALFQVAGERLAMELKFHGMAREEAEQFFGESKVFPASRHFVLSHSPKTNNNSPTPYGQKVSTLKEFAKLLHSVLQGDPNFANYSVNYFEQHLRWELHRQLVLNLVVDRAVNIAHQKLSGWAWWGKERRLKRLKAHLAQSTPSQLQNISHIYTRLYYLEDPEFAEEVYQFIAEVWNGIRLGDLVQAKQVGVMLKSAATGVNYHIGLSARLNKDFEIDLTNYAVIEVRALLEGASSFVGKTELVQLSEAVFRALND